MDLLLNVSQIPKRGEKKRKDKGGRVKTKQKKKRKKRETGTTY